MLQPRSRLGPNHVSGGSVAALLMELTQEGNVRLGFNAAENRWLAVNLLTGESALLPDSGNNEWRMSFHQGDCLLENSAEKLWLDDCLPHRVVQADGGELYLVDDNDSPTPLHTEMHKNTACQLNLVFQTQDTAVTVYKYDRAWAGARVWWSLTSLRSLLQLESKMSEQQWRESWWPWWVKMMGRLGWHCPPHFRRAVPLNHSAATNELYLGYVEPRNLAEATCSTFALLAVCARCAYSRPSSGASPGKKNKKNEHAWREFLEMVVSSFLTTTSAESIVLYIDEAVVCEPMLPLFGANPLELHLRDGVLDLSPLQTASRVGTKLLSVVWNGKPDEKPKMPIADVLTQTHGGGVKVSWAFRQFVHIFACKVESKLTEPERHVPPASPMEVDDSDCDLVPVGQASGEKRPRFSLAAAVAWYQGSRKAIKYFYAGRRCFRDQLFVSMAVDASRLSRKAVMLGALATPANVATWAPPQVGRDREPNNKTQQN